MIRGINEAIKWVEYYKKEIEGEGMIATADEILSRLEVELESDRLIQEDKHE